MDDLGVPLFLVGNTHIWKMKNICSKGDDFQVQRVFLKGSVTHLSWNDFFFTSKFTSPSAQHIHPFPAPAASAMPWAVHPWENRFLHGEGRDVAKASCGSKNTSWGRLVVYPVIYFPDPWGFMIQFDGAHIFQKGGFEKTTNQFSSSYVFNAMVFTYLPSLKLTVRTWK